jgi:hypothetical protein
MSRVKIWQIETTSHSAMNYHDEIKQVTNGQIITAQYLEKLVRVTILRVLGSFVEETFGSTKTPSFML